MVIAAFLSGFMGFGFLLIAALNFSAGDSGEMSTSFTYLGLGVLSIIACGWCLYWMGREKQKWQTLTKDDLDNDSLYKALWSMEFEIRNGEKWFVALLFDLGTKKMATYCLPVLPTNFFRGRDVKNLSDLKIAVDAEKKDAERSF